MISCVLLIVSLFLLVVYSFTKQAQEKIYDRVIIIGVDGAGSFVQDLASDDFWSIFEKNNVSFSMEVAFPSLSAESWGSMIYSVDPETHGLTNDSAKNRKMTNADLPSMFKLVHEQFPDAEIASIVAWSPINYGIIDGFDGMYLYPSEVLASSLPNEDVVQAAKEYLDSHDPKLLFIHFDGVDHAGHAYGWGSDEFFDALISAEKDIKTIYEYLGEKNYLENSLFIVTADHGGNGNKHGGDSEAEMNAMFAIYGDRLNTEEPIGDIHIVDIPSIVLHAFRIDAPEGRTGVLPEGIFVS